MYKVFIADDEEIIRDGLCRALPYEELGLTLVGAAEDGEQALREIARLQPDIVLTDVQMPFLDGLSLVEAAREASPRSKFVLITGYGEFEYARRAVQLGVKQYLLKPIQLPELYQTLSALCTELGRELADERALADLRGRVESDQRIWEQRRFRRFVMRRTGAEEFLCALPPELREDACCIGVLLRLDSFDELTGGMAEEQVFGLSQTVERALLEQAGAESVLLTDDMDDSFFALLLCADAEEAWWRAASYVRRLRAGLPQYRFTTVTAGVYPGVRHAPRAYDCARRALERAFILDGGRDLTADEAEEAGGAPDGPVDVSRAVRSLATFNKALIRQDFDAVAEEIARTKCNSFLYTRMLVSVVYSEVVRILTRIRCPVGQIVGDPAACYKKMLSCQTLTRMMGELYGFVCQVCDFVGSRVTANQGAVDRAKVYLDEHYRDPGLTLDAVAAEIGISPNYLSALFKQSLGQSFIGYLTSVRIRHAKQLLAAGDCHAYEVAEACGYENPAYFSTIFKKHVGMAPSEYRKKHGAQEV